MTRSAASRSAAAADPASGLRALARAIASESDSGDCAEAGAATNRLARRTGTTRCADAKGSLDGHASLETTGAILTDRSPAGYARKVEVLDRESGEAGILCTGATKVCRACRRRRPPINNRMVAALANDYGTVDFSRDSGFGEGLFGFLPGLWGLQRFLAITPPDAWLGLYRSTDGASRSSTGWCPGSPPSCRRGLSQP